MARPVYKIVTGELKRQMSRYRRSQEAEEAVQFGPCFNFTGHKSIKIPDLTYQFTGGINMVVAGESNFLFIGGEDDETSIACFYMTTHITQSLEFTPGPSIILGNSQHVDYYVQYDLKNERLGFRQQTC